MELSTKQTDYSNETPSLIKPSVVGFYSMDEKGQHHPSTQKLSYLRWNRFSSKNIRLDLTIGEHRAVKHVDEVCNINGFYRYLSDRPSMVHNFASSSLEDVGFICNREVLKKIADMPYEGRYDETFAAYLYQGNIYLCHIPQPTVYNPQWERYSRWGFKFEQYVLSENPNVEPDTSVPVKEGEQFCCVFKTSINNHRLLFAGRMHGIIIEGDNEVTKVPDVNDNTEEEIINELKNSNFIDVKSSNYREDNAVFQRFKSKYIYLESYFSGIETIVIGYRNMGGIVDKIKRYDVSDMINIGRGWRSGVCINFLKEFLTYVKKCFNEEISKLPDFKSGDDIKKIQPIELIFERKCGANFKLRQTPCNKDRQYLYPWFLDGVNNAENV